MQVELKQKIKDMEDAVSAKAPDFPSMIPQPPLCDHIDLRSGECFQIGEEYVIKVPGKDLDPPFPVSQEYGVVKVRSTAVHLLHPFPAC